MGTRKAEPLARSARLDAVGAAFHSVASGKVGSVKRGARVKVGELAGSTRSAWWNWLWRVNPANPNSKFHDERIYNSTVTGSMPLVVEKGITYLVLTGEEVKAVRDAYKSRWEK